MDSFIYKHFPPISITVAGAAVIVTSFIPQFSIFQFGFGIIICGAGIITLGIGLNIVNKTNKHDTEIF